MTHADTDLMDGYLALEDKLCSFQALGMVRLLVCQLISVTVFSVDHRTVPLAVKLYVVKICTHMTINRDLQSKRSQEENSI